MGKIENVQKLLIKMVKAVYKVQVKVIVMSRNYSGNDDYFMIDFEEEILDFMLIPCLVVDADKMSNAQILYDWDLEGLVMVTVIDVGNNYFEV